MVYKNLIRENIEILNIILILIMVLISIAYITLAERKVMGRMQRRIGPNIYGSYGLLQPIFDGVKAILKEIVIPRFTSKKELLIGPIIILIITLIVWIPFPFSLYFYLNDIKYNILYIFALSSLNVYIYIFSGWSSFSKFAFLGSLRSIAQLISYEVSIGIIFLSLILLNNSFNLHPFYLNQIFIPFFFPLIPIFILFFFSILAETNRTPFDLPEAESELIAGYLIEFGGFAFASIYLAEYGFILLMSSLCSLLFFSIFIPIFTGIFIFFFIYIRATLPRLRYDQLMNLGWFNILPFSVSYLLFITSFLLIFIS